MLNEYELMLDEELLSLVVRDRKVGTELISKFGGLRDLLDATEEELTGLNGIGVQKVRQLTALKELAKRFYRPDPLTKYKITSPKDAYYLTCGDIAFKSVKCYVVLLLDTKNQVIHKEIVSIGCLGSALLDARLTFISAIRKSSNSIIIITNSSTPNDTNPTNCDIDTCNMMVRAGEVLGIRVTDFLVISQSKYYSFKENHLL